MILLENMTSVIITLTFIIICQVLFDDIQSRDLGSVYKVRVGLESEDNMAHRTWTLSQVIHETFQINL